MRPIASDPGSMFPAMPVRALTDGQDVDAVLLVRERELRARRDGADYLRLVLADRTVTFRAVVWDYAPACAAWC